MTSKQTNPASDEGAPRVLNARGPEGDRSLAAVESRFEIPLVHAMETQRAIRRILPEPLDPALVRRCVELATKAPSAGNDQSWQFIVVTDRAVKAEIGVLYAKTWKQYSKSLKKKKPNDASLEKMFSAIQWQVDNFVDVPAVVVPCLKGGRVAGAPVPFVARSSYFGSIYPTVQNLLLAARALGLGANVVTAPTFPLGKLRRALGAPRSVTPVCVVPMGWPVGRYGPTTRVPVDDILHIDQYGQNE